MAVAEVKTTVLVVGAGGVGTMAAYALETGGKAAVTAVLRSNYKAVAEHGFSIDSVEHGNGITGFRPAAFDHVPDSQENNNKPFDYVLVTTKNVADGKPSVADIIAPAVHPGHTTIVLLQNGLNIEKPLIKRFPSNIILSGVSLISATATAPGKVRHDDPDIIFVGPFPSQSVPPEVAWDSARKFVDMYNAGGKVNIELDKDVKFTRWRKLLYNASYNSVAATLRMDTSRMRISEHIVDNLIKPIMYEIKAIAQAAAGVDLPQDAIDFFLTCDAPDSFFKPSMCQDIEKGNMMEFENIVGEPLREAQKLGIKTPVLETMYGILKGLQWQTMESKGLVKVEWTKDSKYT